MVTSEDIVIILHGKVYYPCTKDASFKLDVSTGVTLYWKIPENLSVEEVADHFNLWAKQNRLKFTICYPKNYYENYFK